MCRSCTNQGVRKSCRTHWMIYLFFFNNILYEKRRGLKWYQIHEDIVGCSRAQIWIKDYDRFPKSWTKIREIYPTVCSLVHTCKVICQSLKTISDFRSSHSLHIGAESIVKSILNVYSLFLTISQICLWRS